MTNIERLARYICTFEDYEGVLERLSALLRECSRERPEGGSEKGERE